MKVLFVGGPCDGLYRELHNGTTKYRVPIFSKTLQPSNTNTTVGFFPAFEYEIKRVPFGMDLAFPSNDVPDSLMQVFKRLVDGYRRPTPQDRT